MRIPTKTCVIQTWIRATTSDEAARGRAGILGSSLNKRTLSILLVRMNDVRSGITTRHRANRTARSVRIGHGGATDEIAPRLQRGTLDCGYRIDLLIEHT